MTEATAVMPENACPRRGKYLTFGLCETEYGFEILKVREIIGLIEVTEVARTPESVRGVMNLRGRIIPVVDLRRVLGIDACEDDEETRVIVVELEEAEVGVVVDRVREVLDVAEEDVEDPPDFGLSLDANLVIGIAKGEDGMTVLLNVEKVLRPPEKASVEALHRG